MLTDIDTSCSACRDWNSHMLQANGLDCLRRPHAATQVDGEVPTSQPHQHRSGTGGSADPHCLLSSGPFGLEASISCAPPGSRSRSTSQQASLTHAPTRAQVSVEGVVGHRQEVPPQPLLGGQHAVSHSVPPRALTQNRWPRSIRRCSCRRCSGTTHSTASRDKFWSVSGWCS